MNLDRKATQAIIELKIRELSKKHNMPIKDVEALCDYPFLFLKEVITKASVTTECPTVKIPGFLIWYVRDSKKQHIKENIKKNEDKKNLSSNQ